jgi:hypothetical protein
MIRVIAAIYEVSLWQKAPRCYETTTENEDTKMLSQKTILCLTVYRSQQASLSDIVCGVKKINNSSIQKTHPRNPMV